MSIPLLLALLATALAQLIKVLLVLLTERRFAGDRLLETGGMPSSHSAAVTALATSLGFTTGWDSPFFAVAHSTALNSDYPADGFSPPYQFWISWGSMLVAFWGLWLSRLNLLCYFSDKATALPLLLIVAGTNYLNYTAIDHAMTHNYQFTLYALMIWATIRFYRRPSFGYAVLIGMILGLACLTRPTEIVMVFIPLLWGTNNWRTRLQTLKENYQKLVLATVVAGLIGSLQLFYWHYATGDWIVYSYQDQGFSWLRPHLYKGIFSYQKGWLVYTPLLVFADVGFYELYHRRRSVFWACLTFFIVNTYIVFAWDIWWYGGSLGQRAMVQSYAVLLFPLAAFVEHLYQTSWWKQGLVGIAFTFCIWYNGMLTYQGTRWRIGCRWHDPRLLLAVIR